MEQGRQLAALLESLYAAALDFSALDTFNRRLAEATDSHIAGVLIHDVAAGRGEVSRIHGMDNVRMAAMLGELDLRDDPWMQRVTPRLATGRVLDTEDILPRVEALRSDFYNDYYRQLGVVQQVASVGLYDGASSVTLSICHGDADRVYGKAELDLVNALTPHWINAYALLRRMQIMEQRVSSLEKALDISPVAMYLLRRDLQLLRSNAAGERLLQHSVLQREGNRLTAVGVTAQPLQALLQRAVCGRSLLVGGDVERVVLHDEHDRVRLIITAHPLPAVSHGEAALLVFAREVRQAVGSLGKALQALFNLTDAEARLAAALYRHADAGLAARECGITPGTAQGRLKVIYSKTGERGQVGLIRLLAALAGVGDSIQGVEA